MQTEHWLAVPLLRLRSQGFAARTDVVAWSALELRLAVEHQTGTALSNWQGRTGKGWMWAPDAAVVAAAATAAVAAVAVVVAAEELQLLWWTETRRALVMKEVGADAGDVQATA